jgi:hypothetical protein
MGVEQSRGIEPIVGELQDAVRAVYERLRPEMLEMLEMRMAAERESFMNAQARRLMENLLRVKGVSRGRILVNALAYLHGAENRYMVRDTTEMRQELIERGMDAFRMRFADPAVPATAEEFNAALEAAQLEADNRVAVSVQRAQYRVDVVCAAMCMCGPM